MPDDLKNFEEFVRAAAKYSNTNFAPTSDEHPFDARNIFPNLPIKVKRLFNDGHYAQATFEAMKFLDREVQRHSKITESGFKLMTQAFNEQHPVMKLNSMASESDRDEQKGFMFLFAGAVLAIRNPRGHEYLIEDDFETCLDHLTLISLLLRRMAGVGYR